MTRGKCGYDLASAQTKENLVNLHKAPIQARNTSAPHDRGRLPGDMMAVFKCLVLLLAAQLVGCSQIAMQAVSVGAMVSMDRRTAGAQLDDETIQLKAVAALSQAMGTTINVYVASYNRQVLLTGEVPDAASRELSERVVSRVANVRTVYNELGVENASTLTQRSTDAYLAARIRAAFFESPDLAYNAFRIVTTRGSVYLLGSVTRRESDRAAYVVSRVPGVNRVVKMLELISEDELARMSLTGRTLAR